MERGARCSEISGAAVAGVRAVPGGGDGAPARAPALPIGPSEEAAAEKATAAVRLERFVPWAVGCSSAAFSAGVKVGRDRPKLQVGCPPLSCSGQRRPRPGRLPLDGRAPFEDRLRRARAVAGLRIALAMQGVGGF